MEINDEREHDRLLLILHTAWVLLDANELVNYLSDDFIYDSMHMLQSLDVTAYKDYIKGKFKAIRESGNVPKVSIVRDSWMGGSMLKLQQGRVVGYLRMKCRNGKIYKLDMCDF